MKRISSECLLEIKPTTAAENNRLTCNPDINLKYDIRQLLNLVESHLSQLRSGNIDDNDFINFS
jgi:hypothetical protein